MLLYFYPRTSTRCDSFTVGTYLPYFISIHAPLRGATESRHYREQNRQFLSTHLYEVRRAFKLIHNHLGDISIHAPLRGATLSTSKLSSMSMRFLSTHLYEVRQINIFNPDGSVYISIHAPLRGATHLGVEYCLRCVFLSTHLYEVRLTLFSRTI